MRGSIERAAPTTGFEPFTLKIQVETTEDLAALWARMNMHGDVLAPAAQAAAIRGPKGAFSREFYNSIATNPEGKKEVFKLLNAELAKAGIRRR